MRDVLKSCEELELEMRDNIETLKKQLSDLGISQDLILQTADKLLSYGLSEIEKTRQFEKDLEKKE